ncbi:hypothetical protein [Streptomyces noursei]|uniref:hypothetical protein n=1 Tax=Streptomyces noursei TaxID=1971 RepID=UPI001672B5CF|nr:hypothetical protein [Streptomyces noursei]MCZ1021091.1 hypothetical protein [Streptomyces noursei]GGX51604.1 hypothetical protein GCM10010341_86390 [Streptomyces noursei]
MKVTELTMLDTLVGRDAAVLVDGRGWSGRVSHVGPEETRGGLQGREVTWTHGGRAFVPVGAEAEVGGTCYLHGTQAGMNGYFNAELRGEDWQSVVFQKMNWVGGLEAEFVVSNDAHNLLDEIAAAIRATGSWQHSLPAPGGEVRIGAEDLRQLRNLVECAVVHA